MDTASQADFFVFAEMIEHRHGLLKSVIALQSNPVGADPHLIGRRSIIALITILPLARLISPRKGAMDRAPINVAPPSKCGQGLALGLPRVAPHEW